MQQQQQLNWNPRKSFPLAIERRRGYLRDGEHAKSDADSSAKFADTLKYFSMYVTGLLKATTTTGYHLVTKMQRTTGMSGLKALG